MLGTVARHSYIFFYPRMKKLPTIALELMNALRGFWITFNPPFLPCLSPLEGGTTGG